MEPPRDLHRRLTLVPEEMAPGETIDLNLSKREEGTLHIDNKTAHAIDRCKMLPRTALMTEIEEGPIPNNNNCLC